MENPEKLYSLVECLHFVERYFTLEREKTGWQGGNAPFKYVEYGRRELKRVQQRLHLTAIAACGLGVLIGLGIGWFIFAG